MFITFTVRPGCTSAQHQTLVRPTERKPFFSWQRFAPARCYHFTNIFSPNKKKEKKVHICINIYMHVSTYLPTYVLTEKHINISKYTYIFVLLKRKLKSHLKEKKKDKFSLQLIYHDKTHDAYQTIEGFSSDGSIQTCTFFAEEKV